MEDFMREFLTVAEEIRRLFFIQFESLPLSKSEFMLLKILNDFEKEGKEVTTTVLSLRTEISKSAVSQTAGNLEKKGYILRREDQKDRRKVHIEQTAAGRMVLQKQEQKFLDSYTRAFESMGEENCRQLILLLRQFLSRVKTDTSGKF